MDLCANALKRNLPRPHMNVKTPVSCPLIAVSYSLPYILRVPPEHLPSISTQPPSRPLPHPQLHRPFTARFVTDQVPMVRFATSLLLRLRRVLHDTQKKLRYTKDELSLYKISSLSFTARNRGSSRRPRSTSQVAGDEAATQR
jgi:hypothetical protein